jgi:hypothetical protein
MLGRRRAGIRPYVQLCFGAKAQIDADIAGSSRRQHSKSILPSSR